MVTDEYSLQDLLEQFKGAMTWESAWLIDNHGWADLRVSNALTLTPNSVDKNFTILLYSSILIALFFVMI
jgi:hypothetical protein